MKKKIFNFINMLFFSISLLHILFIINDNYNYLKISLVEIGYIYFLILIVFAILINFFGNTLNYNISINFLKKLSFIKFTEINLIGNLINELLPLFGILYKGYILKKFKLSYFNYFNALILWKILNIYFLFALSIFYILIFEDKFHIKFIAFSLIILQFICLHYYKSFKFTDKCIQNKSFNKLKFFFLSFKNAKQIIIINLLLMHFANFFLYYMLINSFISLDLRVILMTYILRNIIMFIPLLNSYPVVISLSTFIFSVLNLDLSFLQSFFINLIYNIIITLGTATYLLLNFIYKMLKRN